MRIYGVSCNAYSTNKRNNPTFGFWQLQMSCTYGRVASELESAIISGMEKEANIMTHLNGSAIGKWIQSSWGLDNLKVRHVNIKGSRDKIIRTTCNKYDYDGISHKIQQDLYPDGDLITTVKFYTNGKVTKVEEEIESIK